jgi:hypothetical protein
MIINNLFQKIWNSNFKKGNESLNKMSEDLGGLKGEFSWIKYTNGVPVERKTINNTITNLSKTTMIRLLAQGANSPYKGNMPLNAADYAISKIRFGNTPYSSYFSVHLNSLLSY